MTQFIHIKFRDTVRWKEEVINGTRTLLKIQIFRVQKFCLSIYHPSIFQFI